MQLKYRLAPRHHLYRRGETAMVSPKCKATCKKDRRFDRSSMFRVGAKPFRYTTELSVVPKHPRRTSESVFLRVKASSASGMPGDRWCPVLEEIVFKNTNSMSNYCLARFCYPMNGNLPPVLLDEIYCYWHKTSYPWTAKMYAFKHRGARTREYCRYDSSRKKSCRPKYSDAFADETSVRDLDANVMSCAYVYLRTRKRLSPAEVTTFLSASVVIACRLVP